MSDYLGIPVATLYDWRVDGVGPKAVKLGRSLRYPESCRVALEPVRAEPSPRVTHLTYAVRER